MFPQALPQSKLTTITTTASASASAPQLRRPSSVPIAAILLTAVRGGGVGGGATEPHGLHVAGVVGALFSSPAITPEVFVAVSATANTAAAAAATVSTTPARRCLHHPDPVTEKTKKNK